MRILCHVATEDGKALRAVLVEDKSLDIPFTLVNWQSHEIIPFDDAIHVGLIGDMSKDMPDMSVDDFDASMRRVQAT